MSSRPNIVYILADDLGYGDLACFNPEGKIPTPQLDRLATEGLRFTDAHSTSAVCTPSRYSILTGRYNWRSTLQQGICGPFSGPLIGPDRLTVAGFLRQHGYRTSCIGKWHLGHGWPFVHDTDFIPDFKICPPPPPTPAQLARWREAFSQPTTGGPTTRGFDSFFGVDIPNWPPFCFMEDDHTCGIPTEFLPPHLLTENQGSFTGPAMPGWNFEQLLPTFASRATAYIAEQTRNRTPFFLFLPLTSPHTPLAVNAPWKGKSGLNLYADFVMETDAFVGRILDALETHGATDNTLVVFTSDNGCAHYIGASDLEALGHRPSAHFRGYKADAWDGGHRIPLIARWPGITPAGSTTDQLVSLSDLFATCAEIINQPIPADAAEDSVSLLPLLRGEDRPIREHAVQHSLWGKFALRQGNWKLVLCAGSGGWSSPTDDDAHAKALPAVQLYDLAADPGEKINLHARYPEIVERMIKLLERLVAEGRSTPGPRQSNDAAIDLWKTPESRALTHDDCDTAP